ncbi:ER degradation-enhancing alpha-mannosidase-like protein 2 [Chytridiales sp. JEL 0842]|nr:ER degradation-enhancing alpha-mannosidase-like protein 2 [Chytridiales sp. JEL 0842]
MVLFRICIFFLLLVLSICPLLESSVAPPQDSYCAGLKGFSDGSCASDKGDDAPRPSEETATEADAKTKEAEIDVDSREKHEAILGRLEEYRLKTKEMFYHAFHGYMKNAFPKDELMSISGKGIDTIGNFSLTLIDALDTLMVMGDKNMFKTAIKLVSLIDFHQDVNVSVFETNIRVVGGLLSAHLMAVTDPEVAPEYDWSLLDLAEDMANRLLPAFNTPTGLPYGTVNLMRGVNKDESKDAYRAVKIHMKKGDWHVDVNMDSAHITAAYFYNLGAFWPGLKILAGDIEEAMKELDAMSSLLSQCPFLPEAINLVHSTYVPGRTGYPLRPEFVESLWMAYRSTNHPSLLETGYMIVDRLNNLTRTEYGFANVKDVSQMVLEDKMESFFLAETLKYLYLLFDPDNVYNRENFVFNTEAHPFPVWHTYRTSRHPPKPDKDRLYPLKDPFPPIPKDKTTDYRGDSADPVVAGFGKGMCLIDDWLAGKRLSVSKWKRSGVVVTK